MIYWYGTPHYPSMNPSICLSTPAWQLMQQPRRRAWRGVKLVDAGKHPRQCRRRHSRESWQRSPKHGGALRHVARVHMWPAPGWLACGKGGEALLSALVRLAVQPRRHEGRVLARARPSEWNLRACLRALEQRVLRELMRPDEHRR